MWLAIDDERNLGCDLIARTPEGAKAALRSCDFVGLCLDNDLGASESGYEILKWALDEGHVPPIVELVTSNPPARDRMGAMLEHAGWVKTSPHKYIRKGHEWAK